MRAQPAPPMTRRKIQTDLEMTVLDWQPAAYP